MAETNITKEKLTNLRQKARNEMGRLRIEIDQVAENIQAMQQKQTQIATEYNEWLTRQKQLSELLELMQNKEQA